MVKKKPESILSKLERRGVSDGRQNSPEDQKSMRNEAIKMYRDGYPVKFIAMVLRVHEKTVYRWCRMQKVSGVAALVGRTRGRKPGTHRKMAPEQELALASALKESAPDQLGLPFYLWSTAALRMHASELVGIPVHTQMARRFLARTAYKFASPHEYYENRDKDALSRWRKSTFPPIADRALKERAQLQWGYTIKIQPVSPVPGTPLPEHAGSQSVMVSASNKGVFRFLTLKTVQNADSFIDFIDRLHREVKCKIFFFHYRFRISDRSKLMDWLDQNASRVEMFTLP